MAAQGVAFSDEVGKGGTDEDAKGTVDAGHDVSSWTVTQFTVGWRRGLLPGGRGRGRWRRGSRGRPSRHG